MKALILVDIQNDFLPGGALAVPEGDAILPIANALMKKPFDTIIATKDWHPSDHESFAMMHEGKNPGDVIDLHGLKQRLWPVHCVQETRGSDFPDSLNIDKIDKIVYKATDKEIDSYSAFFDNGHRKETNLNAFLKEKGIKDLYIAGLATDYCVLFTVLDGLKLGYSMTVIEDGCRGIDLNPGDVENAFSTIRSAGAKIIKSSAI